MADPSTVDGDRPRGVVVRSAQFGGDMLKGFRNFILRGNVIDLAVGIVIGAAFSGLITQLTKSFLEPLIRVISGGGKLSGTFVLRNQTFDYAAFVNVLISFALTAAALYFLIVLPMNKLAERRKRGEEPPSDAPSEEVRLLTEIRDALVANRSVEGAPSTGTVSGTDTIPAPRQET